MIFTGRISILTPNQQCQGTEGIAAEPQTTGEFLTPLRRAAWPLVEFYIKMLNKVKHCCNFLVSCSVAADERDAGKHRCRPVPGVRSAILLDAVSGAELSTVGRGRAEQCQHSTGVG